MMAERNDDLFASWPLGYTAWRPVVERLSHTQVLQGGAT